MSNVAEHEGIEAPEETQLAICFDIAEGIRFVFGETILVTVSGEELSPLSRRVEVRSQDEICCHFTYEGEVQAEHVFSLETPSHRRVTTRITCDTPGAIGLARTIIGDGSRVVSSARLDRIFWQTEAMDGFSGLEVAPAAFTSWGMAALTQTAGNPAILTGFGGFETFQSEVSGTTDPASSRSWRLRFSCELEGQKIHRDRSLQLPDLLLRAGDSLVALLEEYAGDIGEKMGSRSFPSTPRGWCSWYSYYGTESEGDILANLESISGTALGGKGAVFQIDDGWNLPHPGHARVWGDWLPGKKFPKGMAWIAGKIREKNLTPGLWLAPFSVDAASELAKEHPEWLVQQRDAASGRLTPATVSGGFALDLTREDVLQFIRATFRRVFSEWGFDYIKIDFLKQALVSGIRQDASITSRQALRNALGVIREEAGSERFILGCGCPFGPAIGICDGMRIGLDVGGGWDPPFTLPEWPDGNCCVKAAARPAFYRHWMHRRWWINDPDCLIVRQDPVACEVEEATETAKRFAKPALPPRFCLSDEEANFWVRLISMLGGSAISSDIWTSLSPERQRLLEGAFQAGNRSARWIDWYEDPDLCFLQTVDAPLKIGIFNFSDRGWSPSLPAEKLGFSSWHFREESTGEIVSGSGPTIGFPPVPPRSARIWCPVHSSGKVDFRD